MTSAILGAAAIEPGQRVLDVGCGTGTLLAAAVATGATAVGIDVSPAMVGAARRRVPPATVLVDDAETADILTRAPGAAFDRVVSRFGVMFFPDPVAAFTNLRRATAPGARLVFACWRARQDNPMFALGSVLEERLDPRPAPPEPGTPGPTSLADPDRLASILGKAGWTSVDLAPLDVVLDYGTTGGDGVEARLATVLAGSTGRAAQAQLEPLLGSKGWEALLDEVRAELRRHLVGGAVQLPSATWLVTATTA